MVSLREQSVAVTLCSYAAVIAFGCSVTVAGKCAALSMRWVMPQSKMALGFWTNILAKLETI